MVYLRGANKYKYDIGINRHHRPTLEARLRKVEFLAKDNRAELKDYESYSAATNITAGSTSVFNIFNPANGPTNGQREGTRVKVYGWKVHVHATNQGVDKKMVLSIEGDTPTSAMFWPVRLGLIKSGYHQKFKLLKEMHNFGSTGQYCSYDIRLKKPIIIEWDGSSNIERNGLFLVFTNHDSSTHSIEFSTMVYYRDS